MSRTIPSAPVLIFLHLPKAAGSTLAHIMEQQYGADAILLLYDSAFGEELTTLSSSQMDRLRVVMGHLYFGTHTFLSRPSAYVTMLRDPVDRVISHYCFVRNDPSHYLYDPARKLSLKEYVEFCDRQEPNNDQTRLLAGKRDTASFGTCSDEMLAIAQRNLEDHFSVVGIMEEFDGSLILMKRTFGWRPPFYTKQNVSSLRLRKEELPLDTLRVIQGYNRLDIELYRYAKELFREQIRRQGSSFARELWLFQKLNAIYGQIHAWAQYVFNKPRQSLSSHYFASHE